jgi:predicted dehydrogenase
VKLCLNAGKHVLCEKPLTVNANQTKVLIELASKNNVLLMEAVWTRFLPAIRSLQSAIQEGLIGEVVTVKADFSLNRELPTTHRLRNPELAGGALLDLGIYPITIASIVFQNAPHSIYAQCVLDDETGVDQRGFYTIDFGQGKTALLTSGYTQAAPCEAVISGTKGHIIVPHFLGAKSYQVCVQDEAPQVIDLPFDEGHEFCAEIEHFHDCLENGLTQSPIFPLNKTLEMMQTMDEIRRQWGLKYSEELEQATAVSH